jgi:hypothetical protein
MVNGAVRTDCDGTGVLDNASHVQPGAVISKLSRMAVR